MPKEDEKDGVNLADIRSLHKSFFLNKMNNSSHDSVTILMYAQSI